MEEEGENVIIKRHGINKISYNVSVRCFPDNEVLDERCYVITDEGGISN